MTTVPTFADRLQRFTQAHSTQPHVDEAGIVFADAVEPVKAETPSEERLRTGLFDLVDLILNRRDRLE